MMKILLIATLSLFGNSEVGEIAWFPSYCPAGWETYVPLEGRMPIGSSVDFPLGSTGGEITHTLSIEEMPSHNHQYRCQGTGPTEAYITDILGKPYSYCSDEIAYTGGGKDHNNMTPYLSLQPCIKINATSTEELEKENIKLRERLDSLEKKLDKLTASLKN